MKISVGDIVKYKGERREVLSIHPDYGIDIGNMQRVSLDEIEEVYDVPVSGEITPGPWRWMFMGNAGNYYLVGNDGRGPAVRSGPKTADGRLMEAAPALQAENERLREACQITFGLLNELDGLGMLDDLEREDDFDEVFVKLNAAIAKKGN